VEFGNQILVGNGATYTPVGFKHLNPTKVAGFTLIYWIHDGSVKLQNFEDVYSSGPFCKFINVNLSELSQLDHLLGIFAGLTKASVAKYLVEKRRQDTLGAIKK